MTALRNAAPDAAHTLKCALAGEVLRTEGTLRLQVTGWSMLPAVMPGDTLLVERTCGDEVSQGDIVLFGREGRLFAHRVVAAPQSPGDDMIVTRGDAMQKVDPPVGKAELLGKVSFIVRNGKLIRPGASLSVSQRALAAVVRRSDSAARLLVGVHGMRQSPKETLLPCQS